MLDSKKRFSDRVENYVKYRPHYPTELLRILETRIKLDRKWVIADIGSGTGISSELFVENNNLVYGVEPNDNMRSAAEKYFAGKANFKSVNGSAEATTLKNESVELVIAGQAFHWFDIKKAREEFNRILKPDRYVVVFWNERKLGDVGFQKDYEIFLYKYCKDYGRVTQRNISSGNFTEFYGTENYNLIKIDNCQIFDFTALKGRLLSSSYTPGPNELIYSEMMDSLRTLFNKYSVAQKIKFDYDTEIYYGKIK